MRLSISIGFDERAAKNLMRISADLRKCSRKGSFRKKAELGLNVLILEDVKNIQPILKVAEDIAQKPFAVNFKSLDRSRRDGGDIYWVRAEENDILTELNNMLTKYAEEMDYECDTKPFKPRVELGQKVIARPDFVVEPFEATACSVAVIKHIPSYDKMNYEVFYRRELK